MINQLCKNMHAFCFSVSFILQHFFVPVKQKNGPDIRPVLFYLLQSLPSFSSMGK